MNTQLPPMHQRVNLGAVIPVPDDLPRDGWCVIGHDEVRGMVLVARNGRRITVYASQVTWDGAQ